MGRMDQKQTMLVNEKKLNMMNAEHRKLLEEEMVNFLFEGKDVHIEGYVPHLNNKDYEKVFIIGATSAFICV